MNETEEKAKSSRPRILPRWLSEWLPEIVLVLVTTGAGLWAAGRWVDPGGDAGYAWSVAYRLLHGERLYRDIYTQYTPLSPYLLAAGARLFGATTRYFLYAYWIPAILAALLLLRCARPFLSTLERLVLAGMIISTSLFVQGPGLLVYPYYAGVVHALLLSVAAFLWLRPDDPEAWRRSFWVGCLAGGAFACKQEIGVAVLVALIAAVAAGTARPLLSVARLIGGFLVALVPVALFAVASAPIESLVHDSRLWPLGAPPTLNRAFFWKVTGMTGRLWWVGAAKTGFRDIGLLGLLAAAACLISGSRERAQWVRALVLVAAGGLGWLLLRGMPVASLPSLSLSALVAFLVAIAAFRSRSLPHRASLAGLATLAGLVGVRTFFSPTLNRHYGGSTHFISALIFLVAVLVFAPRVILGETRAASILRNLLAAGLMLLFWRNSVTTIRALRYPNNVPVETRAGTVFVWSSRSDLLEAVRNHSSPGERVLILPESYAIDALFQLREVSPLPIAVPGWFDQRIEKQLLARLEQSPPDLVISIVRSFKEYGSEPFGVGYGRATAEWCARNFEPAATPPQGQVLRRR